LTIPRDQGKYQLQYRAGTSTLFLHVYTTWEGIFKGSLASEETRPSREGLNRTEEITTIDIYIPITTVPPSRACLHTKEEGHLKRSAQGTQTRSVMRTLSPLSMRLKIKTFELCPARTSDSSSKTGKIVSSHERESVAYLDIHQQRMEGGGDRRK